MKEFIAKKLGGKRVRLTEPAHPMEAARMESLGATLSADEPRSNAIKVRSLLGWDIVSGYILFEL